MKTSEKEIILCLIFTLSTFCGAILSSGYEFRDITADRRYGCIWEGGTTSAVICNCRQDTEEMYITANSISSYETSKIEINHCKKLKFGPQSIADMRNLRKIHLNNNAAIIFEKSSLNWYGYKDRNQFEERYDITIPSLKIHIENSNITQISSYSFEGRINEIIFNNVIIENIEPFSFTSLLQTQNILIKNTELKNIRLQPFKKFSTENLELNNVKAQLLPSRLFSNITVYENFLVKNCNFTTVRSGAFLILNPKSVEIVDTRIDHLDGDAFKIIARGNVLFKNNEFNIINDGAFRGITPNSEEITTDLSITFDSNTFTHLTRDSLRVDNLIPKFFNLKINEECNCKSIDNKIKESDFYTEIKCLYKNEFVTISEFKTNMCSIIASYSSTIIIVGIVLIVFILILAGLIVYYKKVVKTHKYGNEKTTKNGNMSLIVPDGRTYRETELHVIVERADLLTTDL